jgi:ATP-binding protein involved in chromosome partitioning
VTIRREAIAEALATLRGPDSVPLTVAPEFSVQGDRVLVSLPIGATDAKIWKGISAEAEALVAKVPGVAAVLVSLTAERTAAPAPKPSPMPRPKPSEVSPPPRFPNLRQVKHVIAVASGKGGVGKSTTACNLALSFRAQGLAVGVLDADIYGPSMPKLFNLKGRPNLIEGRTMAPLDAYGCKVMSIGFVVDVDKALVWRGPMVASAITQMLRDIAWGPLDILIVDMPPGTGDAQLTLAQQAPLAGAVIVSTPQDLSLIDARRGVEMFRAVNVPILGLIENMSYFLCDQCGKRHHIFAHGGARTEAGRLAVPFLGEIPLDPAIRERSDSGMPIVVTEPDGPQAQAFMAIATAVLAGLT